VAIPQRLARKLQQTLDAAAEDLMTWMQGVESQRDDIRELRADIAELGQELRREFRQDIVASEGRLLERIHQLDLSLREVKSDLMKWSFVFWCGAVAAIAALAGVLR
jgi:hypothetical protein